MYRHHAKSIKQANLFVTPSQAGYSRGALQSLTLLSKLLEASIAVLVLPSLCETGLHLIAVMGASWASCKIMLIAKAFMLGILAEMIEKMTEKRIQDQGE